MDRDESAFAKLRQGSGHVNITQTHLNDIGTDVETQTHRAVVDLFNAIITGGNSVRRP